MHDTDLVAPRVNNELNRIGNQKYNNAKGDEQCTYGERTKYFQHAARFVDPFAPECDIIDQLAAAQLFNYSLDCRESRICLANYQIDRRGKRIAIFKPFDQSLFRAE